MSRKKGKCDECGKVKEVRKWKGGWLCDKCFKKWILDSPKWKTPEEIFRGI